VCDLYTCGRAQREAMATIGVLKRRPDLTHLFQFRLDLISVQGSLLCTLAAALEGLGQCGGAGGGAG